MQAPQGSGCPVLFVITVLAVLSGTLTLMACNMNATPAMSQKLHQGVSVSLSRCCSIGSTVLCNDYVVVPNKQSCDQN